MIRLIQETRATSKDNLKKAEKGFDQLLSRTDLGFFQLPRRENLWHQSQDRAREVRNNSNHLAVLGIGGSSLGGRALLDAFGLKTVDFFENVDGRDFWERLHSMKSDLARIHWVIVSKSGQTIETLGQASFVSQYLKENGLSLEKNATVITEKKSNPLHDWAVQNKIPILEIPVDVGGRFSVLTPVGLFPAAFSSLSVEDIKSGANWALAQGPLVSSLAAQSLTSFENQEWITAFWVYCTRLYSWGLWTQQLWAESLAKKVNRTGLAAPRVSTPLALIGANDQHSVLQQLSEGARDKFIWFLRVKDAETFGPSLEKSLFSHQKYLEGQPLGRLLAAEAEATSKALHNGGVHSLTLECSELSPRMMGALFMLMELVVGTLGECHDINAFDQPGVELGKRLALDILK